MSQPYGGGNNYPYYPPQQPPPGGPPPTHPYGHPAPRHPAPQQRPPQQRPPHQQRPPQQQAPASRPPSDPGPPRKPFPWATFWSAVGSIVGVVALVVTLLVQNNGSGGGAAQMTSSSSPTVSATGSATPSGSTVNEEARLRRAVPATSLDRCARDADASARDAAVVAALDCYTTDGVLPNPVLVLRYSDADALNSAVAGESQGVDSVYDGCRQGKPDIDTWGSKNSDSTKGRLVCRTRSGSFRIAWSFDDNNVLFVAEDPDHSRVYGWWRDNANGVLQE